MTTIVEETTPQLLALNCRNWDTLSLSNLAAKAVEDSEEIVREMNEIDNEGINREYDLTSMHWHLGTNRYSNCKVCLAGAFMARNTVGIDSSDDACPYEYNDIERNLLLSIEEFRMGHVTDALTLFGYHTQDPETGKRIDKMVKENPGIEEEIEWDSEEQWTGRECAKLLKERALVYDKYDF